MSDHYFHCSVCDHEWREEPSEEIETECPECGSMSDYVEDEGSVDGYE